MPTSRRDAVLDAAGVISALVARDEAGTLAVVRHGDCAEIEKVLDGWDKAALSHLSVAERVVVKAARIRDGWLASTPADQVVAGLRELARDEGEWSDYSLQPGESSPL